MSISREPVVDRAWYIAGPMTGIPQFNVPLFDQATEELRNLGMKVTSPAELDSDAVREAALASSNGDLSDLDSTGETWGDMLARDVKMVADDLTGIILLNGWEKSRGARLEAFVGILCNIEFARYVPDQGIEPMNPLSVLTQLVRVTHWELANATD